MFLEILIFTILGILLGLITGLIPGLHPNTIFAILLSLLPLLSQSPIQVMLAFVVAVAVSNTLFNFIPSILFGAPEEDSALSVLPGHKFLLRGKGYEALFLTVMGGLGVMLLTLSTLPTLFYFLPKLYTTIKPHIHALLLLIVLWMIFLERGKKKLYALFVFLLVGLFGFISLNSIPSEQALFPALSGLFGISILVTSIITRVKIPEQKKQKEIKGLWLKGSLTGWLAGLLAGLLPGIGSAQAGIIAAQALKAKTREFLIALGGINTCNIMFTFIVFYVIGKTRSGAVWLLSQMITNINIQDVFILVCIGLITTFISAILTLKVGSLFIKILKRINYKKINLFTISIILILVFTLTGPLGLLVSITGMFIGLLTINLGVRRTHLMGFLLLPTIAYFSGLNPLLLKTLGL